MQIRYTADYVTRADEIAASKEAKVTGFYEPRYTSVFGEDLSAVIAEASKKNCIGDECYLIAQEEWSDRYSRWDTIATFDIDGTELH